MKIVTLLVACAALCACSTAPTRESIEQDRAKAEAIRAKTEEARLQKQQVEMDAHVSLVPKWAMDTPKPDGRGFYAVGMGESDNLNIAMRKAKLEAEFGLAKLYKQELTGSERSFVQEQNSKNAVAQYTSVIDKLVTRVDVVGYETLEQEVKPIRGIYHSWVLLKMPYAQFNKVLHDQRSEQVGQAAQQAFDDLERRVKARQAERAAEDRLALEAKRKEPVSPANTAESKPQSVSGVVTVDLAKLPDASEK